MRQRWQTCGLAAAIILIGCVRAANAQTVIVKGTPSGMTAELSVNGTSVGTATPDAEGLATIAVPAASEFAAETRTNLYIDRCATSRRVHLAGAALAPPAEGGCVREALTWAFLVRRDSTFVIDISGTSPLVRMRRGRAPEAWLRYGPGEEEVASPWGPTPTGLVVFGGAGLALFNNLADVACGNVGCATDESKASFAFGATYWVLPFLGVEAQYVKPSVASVEGNQIGYRFGSTLESRIFTVAGNVAAPLGRVRLFGRVGMNRHQTLMITTQTVDDATRTNEDGSTTLIPGATQTYNFETKDWGYLFGGGAEVWLTRHIAAYGDLSRVALGGDVIGYPEATASNAAWLIHGGIRVRIGR